MKSTGRSYVIQGQIPKGILYFKRAIEVDPQNAEAYDRLGGSYFAIGEYDSSRITLDNTRKGSRLCHRERRICSSPIA